MGNFSPLISTRESAVCSAQTRTNSRDDRTDTERERAACAAIAYAAAGADCAESGHSISGRVVLLYDVPRPRAELARTVGTVGRGVGERRSELGRECVARESDLARGREGGARAVESIVSFVESGARCVFRQYVVSHWFTFRTQLRGERKLIVVRSCVALRCTAVPAFKQALLLVTRATLIAVPIAWRWGLFKRFPIASRKLWQIPLLAFCLTVGLGLNQSPKTARWRLLLMTEREEMEWSDKRCVRCTASRRCADPLSSLLIILSCV